MSWILSISQHSCRKTENERVDIQDILYPLVREWTTQSLLDTENRKGLRIPFFKEEKTNIIAFETFP